MRRRARILCLFLVLSILLGPLGVACDTSYAAGIDNPWDGVSKTMPEVDESGTYLISNAAELAWFAERVNAGYGEINARLINYIYLNSYNTSYPWIMIGNTEETPYKGRFDGNGNNIVYMRAEISTEDPEHRYAGLFGVVDGGEIRNLSVQGKVINNFAAYDTEGRDDQFYTGSGGIVGYLKSGQVINCTNYTRTTMEGDSLYRNAGGLVGINSGLIVNCVNEGKLTTNVAMAQNHVGGIAGLVYGSGAQVMNCINEGSVQGYFCVGGIAGAVKGGAEITSCVNYGTVRGNMIIGGIAGRLSTTGTYSDGSAKECAIRNVYSLGEMDGYGSGAGSRMGGIVGEMGYENWTQEALPPMPVLENAYSTVQYTNSTYDRRGAVIGYVQSGCFGAIYGMTGSGLNPVAARNNRSVQIIGESLMVSPETLQSVGMIEKLGAAFTMPNASDTANGGFPKLAWQGLPSDLLDKAALAQLELNSWLSAENRQRYGSNYAQIESIVERYRELVSGVTTEERLNEIMKDARLELNTVMPSAQAQNELAEMVDTVVIALQEYYDKLLDDNPGLTEEQKTKLTAIVNDYVKRMNEALSPEQVKLLLRDGKDALEDQIAVYEADKRLAEIKANAIAAINVYRADTDYGSPWMSQIAQVRERAAAEIESALSSTDVTTLLEQAKYDIDNIIDQVPEEGAWNGTEMTEPVQDADGVYEITTAEEMAWFAYAVNNLPGGEGLSARLLNDISLGYKNWTPIGAEHAYTGSFDGGGHTIRGLKIDLAETYAGLFGLVDGSAGQIIENLTVTGNISVGTNVKYAGGIAACVNGGGGSTTIYNCHNKVNITLDQVSYLGAAIGGIAGSLSNATVSQCSNTGSVVFGPAAKGGITYSAGGLVGYAGDNASVQSSYNGGYVADGVNAGGVIGSCGGGYADMLACYDYGEVSGLHYAGGLIGYAPGSSNNFKWSYSSGPVNIRTSGRAIGALFGSIVNGSYESLYALKRSDMPGKTIVGTSVDFTGAGRFLTDEELKSEDILNSVNAGGAEFVRDILGFRNGFPILSWEITLDTIKSGAVSELQTMVSPNDYTEESWAEVQMIISDAVSGIQAAGDADTVYAILTNARQNIYAVETKQGSESRRLEEAQANAIAILETYVDLSLYRDEEAAKIRTDIADASRRIYLADNVDDVNTYLEEAKDKIGAYPTFEQYLDNLNRTAAARVDSYINEIGEVTYTNPCKLAIDSARLAYDSLSPEQAAYVTLYQTLLDAEDMWAALAEEFEPTEEDEEMAAEVDALIAAIGEVTEESGDAIDRARTAYETLTEKQKVCVTLYADLVAAENEYDQLMADPVINAISALGDFSPEKKDAIFEAQDLYDGLTDSQKAKVTNAAVLRNMIDTYYDWIEADKVESLIDAIGDPAAVTIDMNNVIQNAANAYNNLTYEQQRLVNSGKYRNLETALNVWNSLYRVQETINAVNRIGTVNSSSGQLIAEARAAYNSLTSAEKGQIPQAVLDRLLNAEKAFAGLQNPGVNGAGSQTVSPASSLRSLRDVSGGSGSSGSRASSSASEKEGKLVDPDDPDEMTEKEKRELTQELAEASIGDGTYLGPDRSIYQKPVVQYEDSPRRRLLWILLILFGAAGTVTGASAMAMKRAAQMRKKKWVYY